MDRFLEIIKKSIEGNTYTNQCLFGVMTCEKLLPNYVFFSKRNHWGDTNILEKGLVSMYDFIYKSHISKEELRELQGEIEDITPDLDDFNDFSASYALDTCCAFIESINFILTFKMDNLLNISSFARDTVDMFVQEYRGLDPNDSNLELLILEDKYYVNECNRQQALAEYIKNRKSLGIEEIPKLREINNAFGSIINFEELL